MISAHSQKGFKEDEYFLYKHPPPRPASSRWRKDKHAEITERLINNSKTLPSPLRSSAGSRRACRTAKEEQEARAREATQTREKSG